MTDITNTTKPNKPEPKYRKKLNKEQLAVLQLLYRFRFASSEQIARHQGKPSNKSIQKRLKILEDQNLIAKRYDKSYKLQGKPAAYYLTPQGARALTKYANRRPDEPVNIKRIYKDKDVSETFIEHCKNVMDVYPVLKALYPTKGRLGYFTKSQLSYEKYEFFPSPLQDAYVHIKTGSTDKHFFLDIFEDSQPFFVLIRRIKKYLDYAGGGDWVTYSDGGLPTILLVVQNKSVHKRLRKRIAYELRESYEELTFATTRLEHLLSPDYKGKVWFPIDENGDDPDEPIKPVALSSLS
ncbi:MAG TPA: replication-relaxation family protein [Candidatus Limnocylindria bacterium]|nr:replication-relaxation family protein [Candidatus Limnocylindria bacterium]